MNQSDLKIGDKVRYKEQGDHGVQWFLDGAILIYEGASAHYSGKFLGAAREDRVGGRPVAKGETVSGFARFEDVEVIEPETKRVTISEGEIAIIAHTTTITVPRKLTAFERTAIMQLLEPK